MNSPLPNRSAGQSLLIAAVVAVGLAGCNPVETLRDLRPEPLTEYDRYVNSLFDAGLDSTALGREWLAASDSALNTPLVSRLPSREFGSYLRSEARAVAYQVSLQDGERLRVSLRAEGLRSTIYLDLFEATGDSTRPFIHRATGEESLDSIASAANLELEYEARRDREFVLRMQPELLRSGRYELTLEVEPSLVFPVEGRGNSAIRSLFGVDREGGRRSHHGIDIFAPRGTPVLAVTRGVVSSIRPNSLGGNVVWLRDESRNQSVYYAHLDRHAVSRGQQVAAGDTVGFVGNSGNARTTPPHLHFGIYRRGLGPIDPLPSVRQVSAQPPRLTADTSGIGREAVTRVAEATLRDGATRSGTELGTISRGRPVRVMGVSANWYRVQLEDGTAGYLDSSQLQLVAEPAP